MQDVSSIIILFILNYCFHLKTMSAAAGWINISGKGIQVLTNNNKHFCWLICSLNYFFYLVKDFFSKLNSSRAVMSEWWPLIKDVV